LVIREHKTDKRTESPYELVPLQPKALEVLKAASDANPENPYAIPPFGERSMNSKGQINTDRYSALFKKHVHRFEKDGHGKLTAYKLRHTFATQLLKNGVPLHLVGSMLLHAPNSPATSIYAKITEDSRSQVIEKMKDIFK
jgi:integrase